MDKFEFVSQEELNELCFEDICFLLDDLWSLTYNDIENKEKYRNVFDRIINRMQEKFNNLQ